MESCPDRSRECLYYIALGLYRLGDYSKAKYKCEELVRAEPQNMQAKSLLDTINSKATKGILLDCLHFLISLEGVIGLALVGGALAAAAGLAIALLRGKSGAGQR